MREPDFDSYTLEELLQAYSGIDREKWPDRAKKIEGILNKPENVAKLKHRDDSPQKEDSVFKLKWKLYGSICMLPILLISLSTEVLYIPTKHGFLRYDESPNAFIFVVIFMFGLGSLSFYQGYTGLAKHKKA
jgi:hypothetical protein